MVQRYEEYYNSTNLIIRYTTQRHKYIISTFVLLNFTKPFSSLTNNNATVLLYIDRLCCIEDSHQLFCVNGGERCQLHGSKQKGISHYNQSQSLTFDVIMQIFTR